MYVEPPGTLGKEEDGNKRRNMEDRKVKYHIFLL